MKNTLKALTIVSIIGTHMYAYDTHNELTRFKTGDVVQVDSCDNYNWCHLTNDAGYVKGHQFKKLRSNLMLKKEEGISFLYAKRPIYKDDKVLFDYIVDHNTYNNINNFYYGYGKVEDILKYENSSTTIKTSSTTNSKKTNIEEVILGKKQQTNTLSPKKDISKEDTKYFVMGALGLSMVNTEQTSTNISTSNLDTKGLLVDLGVGYRYNEKYFTTVNVQKSSLDEISIVNYYLTANYQFNKVAYKPYVGFVLGRSELTWEKDPVTNVTSKEVKSTKTTFGLQVGVNYKLKDNLSLFAQYQLMNNQHKTLIGNGDLTYNRQNNILIGLKYEIK